MEEKPAFVKEREGKISFKIEPLPFDMLTTTLYSDEGYVGFCTLTQDIPFEDLASFPPKPNYLFMDTITVKKEYHEQGYGYLIYKEAMKYAKNHRFRGLVSSKNHRNDNASKIVNRLTTFSDRDYDYIDV